jgi:FMN phosphatase YigB (HAD superfamily)
MIRTVLIDLDDTLLVNSMDRFLPAYFQRLGDYLSEMVDPERMLAALMAGTRAMLSNEDPTALLGRTFADIYYPQLDLNEAQLTDRIQHFYAQIFPLLQPLTALNPGARALVEQLIADKTEVVIATNPLFPRLAIEERLRWAGIPVDEFDYTLVTSYEHFHFTKPKPAYYTEILGLLGRRADEAVMIGNDVSADLEPAREIGMPVFHLHAEPAEGYPGGDFQQALEWLRKVQARPDEQTRRNPEVILARFKGYLAALHSMAGHCDGDAWRTRPRSNEWAPIEILAHLADVEQEVNLPRLKQLKEQSAPHLPAFDTDSWAEQRGYLGYDPENTLQKLIAARLKLISTLEALDPSEWQLEGTHSLLGPTSLAELMHIAAEHDLLHLAQLRRTIAFPE